MKIGFVAEPYETENASGMGYVVLEFMQNLARQHQGGDSMVVYSSRPVDKQIIGERVENRCMPRSFIKKWLFFFRMREDIDTLLFMAPMLPLVIPRRIKAVMLCQELASQKIIPDSSEAFFSFVRDRILMPISFRRAVHIDAASQATKDDIVKFYNVPPKKITVIFDGFQDFTPVRARAEHVPEDKKPFFFFTGKIKYRKNVHGIVSAFIQFKKRTASDCKLIIGGSYGGDYYEKMRRELELNGLIQDVYFAGYVSIEQLCGFYEDAIALVFPSFNDGFGMPIAEAMSLGTPVITSGVSSTVEVAGNAALLVDPHSIDEISLAMERIYTDAGLRKELIVKGKIQSQKFSWPRSGKQLLDLLHLL